MTRSFSVSEYADIVFCYGLADGNSRRAQTLYQERYPTRRIPHRKVFQRTFQRLRDTGSVLFQKQGEFITALSNSSRSDQILNHFEENPSDSLRRAALELNTSRSSVFRTLHVFGQHPYHVQKV